MLTWLRPVVERRQIHSQGASVLCAPYNCASVNVHACIMWRQCLHGLGLSLRGDRFILKELLYCVPHTIVYVCVCACACVMCRRCLHVLNLSLKGNGFILQASNIKFSVWSSLTAQKCISNMNVCRCWLYTRHAGTYLHRYTHTCTQCRLMSLAKAFCTS